MMGYLWKMHKIEATYQELYNFESFCHISISLYLREMRNKNDLQHSNFGEMLTLCS